jgi:hypothetical protein
MGGTGIMRTDQARTIRCSIRIARDDMKWVARCGKGTKVTIFNSRGLFGLTYMRTVFNRVDFLEDNGCVAYREPGRHGHFVLANVTGDGKIDWRNW